MITRNEFVEIHSEIKNAIIETLQKLKINSPENYILFLADAEYQKDFDTANIKQSPYVIDSRIDKLKDSTRLRFLNEFLNKYYEFPLKQNSNIDDENRINLELMIYTHIWESNSFLKKLFRLAQISNGEKYSWKVAIPDMKKREFIKTKIKDILEITNNPILKIIEKGYHSSLRNAFAHSEYSIDYYNNKNRIALYNYKSADWELKEITFNDWSKRFVYSSIFTYYFITLIDEARSLLIEDFKTDIFTIDHPKAKGGYNRINIQYNLENNNFSFKI